mmetsp:Transcript_1644/g.2510  ORF Transcript_1644/g.2510 Transcript_1644/m.2510 type:complete len:192 (+) Transcript_1644:53-628(+)
MRFFLRALAITSVYALSTVSSNERALGQIFGRLADKCILLDIPGAGTPEMRNCCHSGCDNCLYSRVFDEMNAAKPKWIALYTTREFIDGRDHTAPWTRIFEEDEELSVDKFVDRVKMLPFRLPMGPKFKISADDLLDEAACRQLFELVADGEDTLNADAFAEGLSRLTGEAHGASWRSFSRALMDKIILTA